CFFFYCCYFLSAPRQRLALQQHQTPLQPLPVIRLLQQATVLQHPHLLLTPHLIHLLVLQLIHLHPLPLQVHLTPLLHRHLLLRLPVHRLPVLLRLALQHVLIQVLHAPRGMPMDTVQIASTLMPRENNIARRLVDFVD
uniref:Uncharacterized protein n=1 Tax=Caenorhabditis japonica TaxID=281687 RepID=A0A8R1HTZ9_CAEJA